MKKHLQQYIGWYLLVLSIGFILNGQSEAWWILILTLLKIPPFDLVGRMFDWAGEVSYKWGMKLRSWKEKQTRPVRVLVTILAIIFMIFLLWIMPDEECVLC
jgi:hypothetical protein